MNQLNILIANTVISAIRIFLSALYTPVLIKMIGTGTESAQFFNLNAICSSVISLFLYPLDLVFAPKITDTLSSDTLSDVKFVTAQKIVISFSLLLLSSLIGSVILLTSLYLGIFTTDAQVIGLIILCSAQVTIVYSLGELQNLLRFSNYFIRPGLYMLLYLALANYIPLLVVKRYGIIGYMLTSCLVGLLFVVVLAKKEKAGLNPFLFGEFNKLLPGYLSLLKLSAFTRPVGVVEAFAVSSFCSRYAPIYYLSKKYAATFTLLFQEGYSKVIVTKLIRSLSRSEWGACLFYLNRGLAMSWGALICFLGITLGLWLLAKYVMIYTSLSSDQYDIFLLTSLFYSFYIFSVLAGQFVSAAASSIDLILYNRKFSIASALVFSVIVAISFKSFGIYGGSLAVGAYYLTNMLFFRVRLISKLRNPGIS